MSQPKFVAALVGNLNSRRCIDEIKEAPGAKSTESERDFHAWHQALPQEQMELVESLIRRAEDNAVRVVLGMIDGALPSGGSNEIVGFELTSVDRAGNRVRLNSKDLPELDDEFADLVGYWD